jgi:hypothetical protein
VADALAASLACESAGRADQLHRPAQRPSLTIPVGYEMTGLQVTITVGSPERKMWWRSLKGTGAPVELVIRGRRRTGHAVATRAGDKALVRVALAR